VKEKVRSRFVILASGNGSNLEAILKKVKSGFLPAEVPFCFSDNPEAKALERTKKLGFSTLQFSPKGFPSREEYENCLAEHIEGEKVDWIVLAGYMRLLGAAFVKRFQNRILNIHPALLPSFKGTHAIRDAFDYGVRYTGVTVHFVSEEMDAGPVIAQEIIPLGPKDTLEKLEKKIHKAEHILYPATLKKLLTQKFKVEGRKVIFIK
jgi:phosphoribosylglycinamide formyltransferase-1